MGTAFREAQLQDARLAHIPSSSCLPSATFRSGRRNLKAVAFLTKPPKLEAMMAVVEQHC